MARVTAQQFADKWSRRMQGATEDIRQGIARVSVSPMELAAAQKDKMRLKVNEAIDSGKWERGLARVSLGDWKAAATEKGVARIAQGAQGAIPKMTTFGQELLTYEDQGLSAIKAMPSTTLEDNINRQVAWTRHMAGFRRSR